MEVYGVRTVQMLVTSERSAVAVILDMLRQLWQVVIKLSILLFLHHQVIQLVIMYALNETITPNLSFILQIFSEE